jgi:putative peptide zinc metalloprotease protein
MLNGVPGDGPRLVPDLGHWPFFPDRPGSPGASIVGSLDLNRFVVLPTARVAVFLRAIELLRSGASFEEADATLRAEGFAVDVRAVYDKLASAGLTLDATGRPKKRVGVIDASIFHIWGADLAPLEPLFRFLGRTAWAPLMVVAGLLFASVALFFLLDPRTASSLAAVGVSRGTGLPGTVVGIALLVSCFLFHEISHGVCAAHFGLRPRRFETGLFLGVMPLFYLRIGGLYTVSPWRRIAVWSAGAFGNFVLAATAFLLAAWSDATGGGAGLLLCRTAATSVALGLFNLFPFLPTDGYFVFSTLLRRHNLRKYAWQTVFRRSAARRSAGSRIVPALYAAAMMGTILVLFGARLVRSVAGLASGQDGSLLRLSLLLLFPALLAFRAWRNRQNAARQTQEVKPNPFPGVNNSEALKEI